MIRNVPGFPSDLDRPLTLLFLLQEFVALTEQKKAPFRLEKFCFYCDLLLQKFEGEELSELTEEIRFLQEETMQETLRAFFTALSPIFFSLRTNENILMYLIEKREPLNRFLGPRTIEELLRTLFPLGLEELRLVLSNGYARRGFEDFFAEKEPLLDALEWENPCDPLMQTL